MGPRKQLPSRVPDASKLSVQKPGLFSRLPYLTVSEFKETWAALSQREKVDLCAAYRGKPVISESDEKILDVIMQQGDDLTWRNIASVLTRHSDRDGVLRFFRERIEKQGPPLSNFYQAVEVLKDPNVIALLSRRFEEYCHAAASSGTYDQTMCMDYLSCSHALWKLTGLPEYLQVIENFTTVSDKLVRNWARRLMAT